MAGMVIIGAGEAGTRAALTLREEGFDGPITLIGGEARLPYERPPLSKALLTEAGEPEPTLIFGADTFERLAIDYRAGVFVAAIERGARRALLQDGTAIEYDKLLLATGAKPRRLTLADGGVTRYLRTYEDALALRATFQPGRRVVIIGAGFIGLECAAAAVERGAAVTVIEAAPRVLARGVPPDIAEWIAARHRAAGVTLILGAGVMAIEAAGDGARVTLSDGRALDADSLVAGIGAIPDIALAEAAGLARDGAIPVDGRLATEDENIFAAGDCVAFPHPLYDNRVIRLEAWRNAVDQGAHAARTMLGSTTPFAAPPWFWSDQYDLHLEIAGLPSPDDRVIRRDQGEGATIDCHLAPDGRLTAACALGALGRVAKDMRIIERLIIARATPDAEVLANPETRLRGLL